MTRQELLLTILAEECVETAQRCSKAIRFTPEEVEPNQSITQLSNAERIVYEFNDIVAVMQMLQEEGVLPKVFNQQAIDLKKEKVEKWLLYSRKRGALEPINYDMKCSCGRTLHQHTYCQICDNDE